MIYIYGLVCPITKNIRYIGKSIRPKGRYIDHLNDKSKTHKVNWISNLKSKGLKPEMVILHHVNDGDDWQKYEIEWIKKAKEMEWNLVNSTDGGDGITNLSGESKKRMLETWRGRKHKPESLLKMSIANKGRKHTEEHKKNMRNLMKGRKITWSEKLKEAVSKFTIDQTILIKNRLKNGEKVKDLAKEYNVHRTTISKIKMDKYFSEVPS